MECQGTKKDGSRCTLRPIKGRPFCFTHDPKQAEKLAQTRSEGGRRAQERLREPNPLESEPDAVVDSEGDVLRLVARTISQVRRGEMEPDMARVIGQLCSVALKAQSQGETDERLKKLEEQLRPLKDMDAGDLMRALREGHRAAPVDHDA